MGTFVGIVILFIILGVIGYIVTIYNSIVRVKNNVEKAWGNIDVLLKQRHDELPKLIKTCEGFMKHESDTLTRVIQARNSAVSAGSVGDKAVKENQLTAALHKLFALAENYPELKSQNNFQHLQTRISGLENDIADRREFYNESVNNYNIRIESFPDAIVANNMGMQKKEMFKVAEADKQDVDVRFNFPS